MSVAFQKTIPILRIFDVEKAKEFYVGFLGFSVDWEHHFEENTLNELEEFAPDARNEGLAICRGKDGKSWGSCSPSSPTRYWRPFSGSRSAATRSSKSFWLSAIASR